jgi:hypothetical protein
MTRSEDVGSIVDAELQHTGGAPSDGLQEPTLVMATSRRPRLLGYGGLTSITGGTHAARIQRPAADEPLITNDVSTILDS